MNSSEVIVHTDQPLTNLLCGKMPIIANRRAMQRQIHKKQPDPVNKIDISAFPPEITTYRRRAKSAMRPHRNSPSDLASSRGNDESNSPNLLKYNKLKKDKDFISRVETDLETRADNKKRKSIQIHQDWEDRYMQPYLEEMKHKLNGDEYERFVAARAISAASASTITDQIQQARAQSQFQKSQRNTSYGSRPYQTGFDSPSATTTQTDITLETNSTIKPYGRPKTSFAVAGRAPLKNTTQQRKATSALNAQRTSTQKITTETGSESFPLNYSIPGKEACGYYDHTRFQLEVEQNPSTVLMFTKDDLAKRPPFNSSTYAMQNGANAGYSTLKDADAKASLLIPYVQLPTSVCDDRIHKFKKHMRNEERLQKIIDESHGIKREKPKLTERNTVDLEAWKILPETRFYDPASAGILKKGRKPYSEILSSTVEKRITQF
ncbi:hypothetical protein M9Y10_039358 [Tritrichomonas musculus]|uniref:Uncharacterized protein n=1 Tax=Tritrichomonas musculus TaxID=1915356 RepID=A0ABR2KAZ2_9EUKA